ncbi:hypothetical protein FRC17_010169, partial [Serendipita sp. 399]
MALIVLAEHLILQTLALVFSPLPPVHRFVAWLFTAVHCRMLLALAGYGWIQVEVVAKKKTFNPIFVLPVAPTPQSVENDALATTGRRTGTGSAAIHKSSNVQRTPINGFHRVSFLKVLSLLGKTPSTFGLPLQGSTSLESIRKSADRPIVVFPECTTSNGRGLLRFADVFDPSISVPVKGFNVFIMCTRFDSPTHWQPSPTCSIPSSLPIPLPQPLIHILTIPLEPSRLTIRLLPPSESPSTGTFLQSDILAAGGMKATLTEACAVLVSQLGKLKRTGQGWEEKTSFL